MDNNGTDGPCSEYPEIDYVILNHVNEGKAMALKLKIKNKDGQVTTNLSRSKANH